MDVRSPEGRKAVLSALLEETDGRYSNGEVGEMLGVTGERVRQYKAGDANPSAETARKAASALNNLRAGRPAASVAQMQVAAIRRVLNESDEEKLARLADPSAPPPTPQPEGETEPPDADTATEVADEHPRGSAGRRSAGDG